MKKIYFLTLAIATVSGIFAALTSFDNKVSAATTTEVVTETEIARQAENTPPTNNWVLYTRNAGTGDFRTGPGTLPLGIGSLELVTPTGADKVFLFNYDHIGTPLTSIDAISYWTYRTAGSLEQVTALNIQVDYNGDDPGGFTTLVFEPVYNTDQGAVQNGTWQNWDAYNSGNARWWSTQPIPGVCSFSCFVPWSVIVANNPSATIVGGFGLNQGSGNPALTAASDKLTIGYGGDLLTYDFEPYRIAQTRDDCKVGGWQSFKRADGTLFRNQGDCVSYINTGN
jgi:hypothetical protein